MDETNKQNKGKQGDERREKTRREFEVYCVCLLTNKTKKGIQQEGFRYGSTLSLAAADASPFSLAPTHQYVAVSSGRRSSS